MKIAKFTTIILGLLTSISHQLYPMNSIVVGEYWSKAMPSLQDRFVTPIFKKIARYRNIVQNHAAFVKDTTLTQNQFLHKKTGIFGNYIFEKAKNLKQFITNIPTYWENIKKLKIASKYVEFAKKGILGSITAGSTLYVVNNGLKLLKFEDFLKNHPKLAKAILGGVSMAFCASLGYFMYNDIPLNSGILESITDPYQAGIAASAALAMYLYKSKQHIE